MTTLRRAAVLLLLLAAPAGAQEAACNGTVPRAAEVVPNDGTHDVRALSESVRAATNHERCQRGLSPLVFDQALTDAAARYAAEMAGRGFFAHRSPVQGRETLRQRADDAGIARVTIAENLITGFFVEYSDGARFSVVDAQACRFRDADTGDIYDRLTYKTMGESLVARWMDSPGHRANILNDSVERHGFGLAVDPDETGLCGGLLGTQLFAGR